jgi:hypothetical protein
MALAATLLGTLVISSQTSRVADDPFAPPPDPGPLRTVRVHAEFIEMPLATYTGLTSRPRSSANDTDLREKCAELIASGEARMLESLCTNLIPGTVALSESLTEFIYPTKRGPIQLPNKMPRDAPEPTPAPNPGFILPNWSAFELKNLGSTFEVEGYLDQLNPGIVVLQAIPTLVAYPREIVWSPGNEQIPSSRTAMPLFYTLEVKTTTAMMMGEPRFVASLSPEGPEGFRDPNRKVMVFFRAEILTVGR